MEFIFKKYVIQFHQFLFINLVETLFASALDKYLVLY